MTHKEGTFLVTLPYHLLLSFEYKGLTESRGNEWDIKSSNRIQRPERSKGEVHPSARGSCLISQLGKGSSGAWNKGRPIYKWLGCVPISIKFNSQQLFCFLWLKQTNKQTTTQPPKCMQKNKGEEKSSQLPPVTRKVSNSLQHRRFLWLLIICYYTQRHTHSISFSYWDTSALLNSRSIYLHRWSIQSIHIYCNRS